MSSPFDREGGLLRGPLLREAGRLPLALRVRWGDVRSRLIDKGRAGRGYRAVARNGRVLYAGDVPPAELAGRVSRLRIQTWHKAILPGERPEPFGLLLCVRADDAGANDPVYEACLERPSGEGHDLALDVGGGLALVFRKRDELT